MMRIKYAEVGKYREEFSAAQGHRCAICQQVVPETSRVLDHCHTSGLFRAMLCRNCNGLEGKILTRARQGQRQFDPKWFLKRVLAYWETHHDATPEHGLIHPTFKTPDEKRLARNAKARAARAKAKVRE
jgi:hypothetical protein